MNEFAWHGTAGGYSNHHCRCDLCATAWRLYQRKRRGSLPLAERLALVKAIPQAPHGSLRRYRKWGCRCELCRRAIADHRARMRANAKQRAVQAS